MNTEPTPYTGFARRRFLQLLGGSLAWLGTTHPGLQAGQPARVPTPSPPLATEGSRTEALMSDAEELSDPGWTY
jgi:hypothetical protein